MSFGGFLVPIESSLWSPQYRRVNYSPFHELGLLDESLRDLDRNLFGCRRALRSAFDFDGSLVGSHVEEDGKYKIKVPLGKNIGPEDVKVTLKDQVMTVEAKREQKSEDGSSRVYQEFTRMFTFPENVQLEEVKSTWTPEGVLQIEAPVTQPQIEMKEPPKATEVPILRA